MKLGISGKALLCAGAALAAANFAWPSGVWVETRADEETAFGDSVERPRYRELVRAAYKAEAAFRAEPVLNELANVRLQGNREIGYPEVEGGSVAAYYWVGIHKPSVWKGRNGIDQETADYELSESVRIEFNAPVSFVSAIGQAYDGENPVVFELSDEQIRLYESTGVIVSGGTATRAIRLDGKPVLRPYTVSEHLDQWETRLRLMIEQGGGDYAERELSSLNEYRRALDAESLSRQAALSSEAYAQHIWGLAQVGSDGAVPLFCIPSDLFLGDEHEGQVRLVSISYSVSDPDDPMRVALGEWIRGFDLDAFVVSLRDR